MEFEARLKALRRLTESTRPEAESALRTELEKVAGLLNSETRYDKLEQGLSVVEVIGHRFSAQTAALLAGFIRDVRTRKLTYSDELSMFHDSISEYQNAEALAGRAIDVLSLQRYLQPDVVLPTLLEAALDPSKTIRKHADAGLKALARYDLGVFFGNEQQRGIGAAPQRDLVARLENMSDAQLRSNFASFITLLEALLSPRVEGARWGYNAVTLSSSTAPAKDVGQVRTRSIDLLFRVYRLGLTVEQRLTVIRALSAATRGSGIGSREEAADMIAANSVDVLHFLRGLVATEDLQVIQKIEGTSFWIFYHGREEVKRAARAVEAAIARHSEYQIYKTLIGFEGIFQTWEEQAKDQLTDSDERRRVAAAGFVDEINEANFPDWRSRILRYAETRSEDLATFPVFYYFLEVLATKRPEMAIRLAKEDAESIASFLIPLLRGLWNSTERPGIKAQLVEWGRKGMFLYQATKIFLDSANLDHELLGLFLCKAIETKDEHTLALVAAVAASNYPRDRDFLIEKLFLPAIDALRDLGNARWIFEFWFRRESKQLLESLTLAQMDRVLESMLALEKIDYHAEEVLAAIANKDPKRVLEFLYSRLDDVRDKSIRTFDAIPFEMHKLDDILSKHPAMVVAVGRARYHGDYGMFVHRGAHLVKTIFPSFSPALEAELLKLLGGRAAADIEFVLAVLRNYEGQEFIHDVAKEIVKIAPPDSRHAREVAIALESTGVVSGAYGFADAYARKIEEIRPWLEDASQAVRDFAGGYIQQLTEMIAHDRKRVDEEIALRKHKYGE